jgi:PPM family protein phosphatase
VRTDLRAGLDTREEPREELGVEVAGVTWRGRRHHENQDQYLIADLERAMFVRASGLGTPTGSGGVGTAETIQGHVFLVADGVGGHEGGRLASSVVVESMSAYVLEAMSWFLPNGDVSEGVELALEGALREAQRRLRQEARRRGVDPRLGTTLTMAYVTWPRLSLMHVGDSRGYIARRGELYRLTRDHTVAQTLLETAEDLDPKIVEARWGHVLENVVGGSSDDLQVDMRRVELEHGDRLLLCTDGLTAYLDDADLLHHLESPRPVQEQATLMAQTAWDRGGHDDITVVLSHF